MEHFSNETKGKWVDISQELHPSGNPPLANAKGAGISWVTYAKEGQGGGNSPNSGHDQGCNPTLGKSSNGALSLEAARIGTADISWARGLREQVQPGSGELWSGKN